MLIDILTEHYGSAGYEQRKYIAEKTSGLSEKQQEETAKKIIAKNPDSEEFPSLEALKEIFEKEESKPKKYFWNICNDCNFEYDYGFSTCPICKMNGGKSSGYKVKVSQNPPHRGVVRWNQESFTPVADEKLCLNCEHKEGSYCWMFGKVDAQCKREDFEVCKCSACCVRHKKFNKEREKSEGK